MTKAAKRRPRPDTQPSLGIAPADRVLLETPLGRENDFGAADRGTLADDEVRRPEIAARPRSEITGRHDEGSGANETIDGLDEVQEALRHSVEDIPASEKPETIEKVPVFDRAAIEPKV